MPYFSAMAAALAASRSAMTTSSAVSSSVSAFECTLPMTPAPMRANRSFAGLLMSTGFLHGRGWRWPPGGAGEIFRARLVDSRWWWPSFRCSSGQLAAELGDDADHGVVVGKVGGETAQHPGHG